MSSRPRALPAGFIAPCLPTKAQQPPSGGLWLHEIKHDGFRIRKDGKRVRLYVGIREGVGGLGARGGIKEAAYSFLRVEDDNPILIGDR